MNGSTARAALSPSGELSVFDRMAALGDATRCRLLLALERRELTVGELALALQLPQSTVSRHLKVLGDEGWVTSRAEGTSRWYLMAADRLDATARRLWALVRESAAATPAAAQDADRLRRVLAERRTKSQEFFSSSAGQWDRVRAELFGRRADLLALLAFLDDAWIVGDLGCGTGQVAEALAPAVRQVIAVDDSAAMLTAARTRLADVPNIELRKGSLEALPLADGELDAATLFLVLHYVADPAAAIAEARRALRPGGRLLVADMVPHDRAEYRQTMGHLWPGFGRAQIEGWLREAGFARVKYVAIAPDSAAKGPSLFAAVGQS